MSKRVTHEPVISDLEERIHRDWLILLGGCPVTYSSQRSQHRRAVHTGCWTAVLKAVAGRAGSVHPRAQSAAARGFPTLAPASSPLPTGSTGGVAPGMDRSLTRGA